MKKIIALAISLAFVVLVLAAKDLQRDMLVFGKILNTTLEGEGIRGVRITCFELENYGLFYVVSNSFELTRLERLMGMRHFKLIIKKRLEDKVEKKEKETPKPEPISPEDIKTRIKEKLTAALVNAARYADVLKSAPGDYWLVLVLPERRGGVANLLKIKIKDMKAFAAGKISEEEFKSRIIFPPKLR